VILSLFEVFVHSNIGYADVTDGILKRRAIFPIEVRLAPAKTQHIVQDIRPSPFELVIRFL